MSFFSWLRIRIWPPHHRNDPRLHPDSPPESTPDDEWDSQSNERHLSASERQWVELMVEHASTFPLECFIRFEYQPEQQAIICYRVERMNQPRLDLGTMNHIGIKHWKHFWRFLYDHFNHSVEMNPLEGEERRSLDLWTSPRRSWDGYSTTPKAVSVRLHIAHPMPRVGRMCNCGCDGPCTAH